MEKIDFVITWLDSKDKKWQEDFNKYSKNKIDESRYRDWDFLRYWFRAIEQNAQWVNKIYFVTYGHIPKWLNTNSSKLVVVNHKDYIPECYLPTFNSCVLEINLDKIVGLSDKFVYFNDDTFINSLVNPDDFFIDGKPLDNKKIRKVFYYGKNSSKINYNCGKIINKYFKIEKSNEKNTFKDIIKIISSFPNTPINGYESAHMATSYLKSTFYEVWKNEGEYLNEVCCNKFRTKNDVSQWLFCYWQIASNNYVERKKDECKYYNITIDSLDDICNDILNSNNKFICLNDGEDTDDFEKCRSKIIDALRNKYNFKSSFEK